MKKAITILSLAALSIIYVNAQNGVAINNSGAAADQSAMLDVSSNTKGFLMPRMSMQERIDIINPVRGLLVYQIDNDYGFWYYDGNIWQKTNSGDNLGNHIATDSLDMDNNKIVNLATCTNNLDAANKEYVDNAVAAGGGSNTPTMISNESGTTMNFGSAIRYCRNLNEGGYTDWYMPSFNELITLISRGGTTVPNDMSANYFWLADRAMASGTSYGWRYIQKTNLSDGEISISYGSETNYTRCVR